jgi:hypothetical protein
VILMASTHHGLRADRRAVDGRNATHHALRADRRAVGGRNATHHRIQDAAQHARPRPDGRGLGAPGLNGREHLPVPGWGLTASWRRRGEPLEERRGGGAWDWEALPLAGAEVDLIAVERARGFPYDGEMVWGGGLR